MSQSLSIPTAGGGSFAVEYAAPPAGARAPALIVIPSIYGNNEGMQTTLDELAAHGYLVISLDPFWRTTPGPLTFDQSAAAQKRKDEWTPEMGIEDTHAVLAYLRTRSDWNGKFAMVGYCFGGRLAMLGLMRLGADAAVTFHGTGMHLDLAEAGAITKPFSFHFGANDPVVPLEQVEAVRAALAGKDGEIEVYPDAGHSFAQVGAPRYSPTAGPLSQERALKILERIKG